MRWVTPVSVLLFLIAWFAAPPQLHAQTVVGVQGGLSIASFTGDDVDDDDVESRTGLLGGGFVAFPLGGRLGLATGLYYAQKGISDADSGFDFEFRLNYLEIPVLLQVGLTGNEATSFSVFGGPSVSFEVGCEIEGGQGSVSTTADCDDTEIETKTTGLNGIVGIGGRHALSGGMVLLGNAGLDFGLTSIDDSGADDDLKNRMWFVQVGVGWAVGGASDGM